METKEEEIESVYHLVHLCIEIDRSLNVLLEVGKSDLPEKSKNNCLSIVTSKIFIDAVSFLDEYDRYFNSKSIQRVKDVRRILKILIREINGWKDLKNYRNKMLAHNYRNGKGKAPSVFKDGTFLTFNVPKRINELQLFIWYFIKIKNVLSRIYSKELKVFNEDVNELNRKKELLEDISTEEVRFESGKIHTVVEVKMMELGY